MIIFKEKKLGLFCSDTDADGLIYQLPFEGETTTLPLQFRAQRYWKLGAICHSTFQS